MNRRFVLAAALLPLLGACAPRQAAPAPEVRAQTSFNAVSFYPSQTGLTWAYLPEGEKLGTAQPYTLRSLGPTIFKGQPVSAFQLTGRGAEQTWFRQVGDGGVLLLGFTKPGVLVNLEPAWRELPARADLRVGSSWQGQSKVTLLDDAGSVKASGTLNYRYDIQDRRQITGPAGTHEVLVITRRVTDDLGGLFPEVQQLFYSPFTGEVKTYEGLMLVAQNYSVAPAAAKP